MSRLNRPVVLLGEVLPRWKDYLVASFPADTYSLADAIECLCVKREKRFTNAKIGNQTEKISIFFPVNCRKKKPRLHEPTDFH